MYSVHCSAKREHNIQQWRKPRIRLRYIGLVGWLPSNLLHSIILFAFRTNDETETKRVVTHFSFLSSWQLHLVKEVKGLDAGPDVRGNGATQLGDERQLLLLCVALHDGTARPHLRHDAPSTPQVNRRPVVAVSQKQLWRSVPQRHYTICIPEQIYFQYQYWQTLS